MFRQGTASKIMVDREPYEDICSDTKYKPLLQGRWSQFWARAHFRGQRHGHLGSGEWSNCSSKAQRLERWSAIRIVQDNICRARGMVCRPITVG